MHVLESERLNLRHLCPDDAAFILELVNEPAWIRYIGDRGVRTLDDARAYVLKGPAAMYQRVGFGLYLVERKEDGAPVGICGLIRRDGLDDVDIGFAFLRRHWGQGYAFEAAAATLAYGRDTVGLRRIVAITTQDNDGSIRVLERIGLTFERVIRLPGDDRETLLFGCDFPAEGMSAAT